MLPKILPKNDPKCPTKMPSKMPSVFLTSLVVFLYRQPSFSAKVSPIEYAPMHLSFEEVAVLAGLKVSMEVVNNISLIVGEPQGILDL